MKIEIDANCTSGFIYELIEVLKKGYEINRLVWKSKKVPDEEAENLIKEARDIEKAYDNALTLCLAAMESMRGAHCAFTIDEKEKVYGIKESKYPPGHEKYMQDEEWVIKIHENDMEPLMNQELQSDTRANSLDRNCMDIQSHD